MQEEVWVEVTCSDVGQFSMVLPQSIGDNPPLGLYYHCHRTPNVSLAHEDDYHYHHCVMVSGRSGVCVVK